MSRSLSGLLIASVVSLFLPQGKGALAQLPFLPSYLVLLLLVELAFYWAHRWAHEGQRRSGLEWLWQIHRTHHASKYMNVLVTMRINLFWGFIVPTPWLLGFAIYLGQGTVAAMVILTIFGWNLITHSHFRWDDSIRKSKSLGPAFRVLEHIFVSPGIHHSHHGYGKDGAAYRNFAVTFSFLDWIFGTLHIPDGRPWKYGVPGKEPHWAEEVFYPLVRISESSNSDSKSSKEKLVA